VAVLNTVRKTERGRHRRSEQGCDGGLENERFRNGKRSVSSAKACAGRAVVRGSENAGRGP
jgi:hypothetical protein